MYGALKVRCLWSHREHAAGEMGQGGEGDANSGIDAAGCSGRTEDSVWTISKPLMRPHKGHDLGMTHLLHDACCFYAAGPCTVVTASP